MTVNPLDNLIQSIPGTHESFQRLMAEVDKTIDIVRPKATYSHNSSTKGISSCRPSDRIYLVLAAPSLVQFNLLPRSFSSIPTNKNLVDLQLSDTHTCSADLGMMKPKRNNLTSFYSFLGNKNCAVERAELPNSQFQFWGSYDLWDDPHQNY
mmetsp:Transcript_30676/g.40539  ORF Transcript_30676/g.40539 Transcript_30676/m.40539 type:complete len:152 (+) Transcript_30676:586-1041(+)